MKVWEHLTRPDGMWCCAVIYPTSHHLGFFFFLILCLFYMLTPTPPMKTILYIDMMTVDRQPFIMSLHSSATRARHLASLKCGCLMYKQKKQNLARRRVV